jgi:hypothetical protein
LAFIGVFEPSLEPIDHVRNPLRRKSPARQRIDHAASSEERGKPGVRFPGSLQRAGESGLFPIRIPLGEHSLDCLAGETARPKLFLEASPSVALPPRPHRGPGGGEVVEPSLPFEAVDRAENRRPSVTAIDQRARDLRAAARPDREEAQGALARRVGRGSVGRSLLARLYLPGGT